jgi:hypothetical protein
MACRGCSSTGCSCSVVGSGDGAITMSGTGTPITSPYTPTFNFDVVLGDLTEDLTACDVLDSPTVPVLLGDGSVVRVPLPCIENVQGQFGGNAFSFTFSGTTTDADPGGGTVRFNNVTVSSVTQIYVDLSDYLATDVTGWLDAMAASSKIRFYLISDPSKWADFTLNSVTSATGYRKLNVTYVDHNGVFTNGLGDLVLDYSTGGVGATGGFDSVQTIETVAGTYTLDIGDLGKYMRCGNASAFNVTVPTNASVGFAIGSHIDFIQSGAGQVTFVASGGVAINASPGLKLNGQWAGATLIKVGTDEWDLVGNLTS